MDTPKNFFLQIGIIATLYASTISFITFLFSLIDNVFPNTTVSYYDYTNSSIRYSISVLIVVFPLFILLSRIYRKAIAKHTDLKDSKLRKWLLYFTLFIAGATVAVDIIVLINTFLGGENLTTSFILKVVSILLVAGGIFYFYLKDIKNDWQENPNGAKIASIIVSAIVIISIVGGMILIGSPSKQRDILNDEQKINDLSTVQSQVVDYYQDKGVLPATLTEVVDPLRQNFLPKNIDTGENYVYEVTGKLSFKICADFKTDSSLNKNTNTKVIYAPIQDSENWVHGIGQKCFDRTIDPARFPVRPVNSKI